MLDFMEEPFGMCRGRCPHRPAGLLKNSDFLVQPCRNRPAEFARFPRCPPGACQRRLLPLPVSVMLVFKSFLMQVGDFISYGVCKFVHKPPLKGEGDQRSWWRGSDVIFFDALDALDESLGMCRGCPHRPADLSKRKSSLHNF